MKMISIINIVNLFIPYLVVFVAGPYLNYSFDISLIFGYMILSPLIINIIFIARRKVYEAPFIFMSISYILFYIFFQYLLTEILKDVKFF